MRDGEAPKLVRSMMGSDYIAFGFLLRCSLAFFKITYRSVKTIYRYVGSPHVASRCESVDPWSSPTDSFIPSLFTSHEICSLGARQSR